MKEWVICALDVCELLRDLQMHANATKGSPVRLGKMGLLVLTTPWGGVEVTLSLTLNVDLPAPLRLSTGGGGGACLGIDHIDTHEYDKQTYGPSYSK